jgi:hypothetical protein
VFISKESVQLDYCIIHTEQMKTYLHFPGMSSDVHACCVLRLQILKHLPSKLVYYTQLSSSNIIGINQHRTLCKWPNAVCCVKCASPYHSVYTGNSLCDNCRGHYLASDKAYVKFESCLIGHHITNAQSNSN